MKILQARRELTGDPPWSSSVVFTVEHDGDTFEAIASHEQKPILLNQGVAFLEGDLEHYPLPWSATWKDGYGRENELGGATRDPIVVRLVRENVQAINDGTWRPGPLAI